ncbi:MAG: hypothetical protein E2O39_01705 [Planctomycetota bacterium]|nr:MAG: hypothetical protein E2O39_01705 [Planctomycetota bacterium]
MRPKRALLLVAVLAVHGCADDSTGEDGVRSVPLAPPDSLERVALDPEPERAFVRVPPRVLYPSPEIAPWTVAAERSFVQPYQAEAADEGIPGYRLVDGAASVPALIVVDQGDAPNRVVVPGPFDPATFNRISLRVACPERETVRVAFRRQAGRVFASDARAVAGAQGLRTLVFDLPEMRRQRAPFDELAIETGGASQGIVIVAIELSLEPLESFVFADGEVPALAQGANGETRRGYPLATGAPLVGELSAGADVELAFAYGVPRAFRSDSGSPTLRVTAATASGGRVEVSLPIGAAEWEEATVELAALGGERATVRFELEGDPAGFCVIAEPRLRRRVERPATVLVITSDTHRGDHVGALGNGLVATPALDALAARGVLFENACSVSNTTNPSHVALFTGLHVRDTRIVDNHSPLVADVATLAEAFRDAGYRTFAVVSIPHLGPEASGLGQGFDRVSAPTEGERDAAESVSRALAFLADAHSEPVFLWLHVFDAHSPYEPHADFDRRYYPGDPFDPSQSFDFKGKFLPKYLAGLRDVTFPHAQYRAEIDYVDSQLARLLGTERVRAGVTLFTADHGESFGAHGVYWDHAELYPDSLHVPLVLAWPGAPRGVRSRVPVTHMDVGRTLLDLAGLDAVPFGGRDLRWALAAGAAPAPRFAIAGYGFSASMEAGGWHLVLHLADHQPVSVLEPRTRHRIELYDRTTDPDCLEDVAGREPARAQSMRAALVRWLGEARAGSLGTEGELTPERRAHLRALGYLGDSGTTVGDEWIDPECACAECRAFQ